MKSRVPRVSDREAAEQLGKIAALKSIFPDTPIAKDFGRDESNCLLILSRFKHDVVENEEEDCEVVEKERRSYENTETADDTTSATFQEDSSQNGMSSQIRQKRRRLALSFATLASKPWKREKIVSEGAIPALIELSILNDLPIQRSCAIAFSYLCKEPSIRAKMIDEGSFAALVALSGSPSKKVKEDCCRALCNLCMVDNYEYRAVRDGVTFAVIQIAAACPDILEICLKLILNLSCVAEKYIRSEEVTEALMHFNTLQLNEAQLLLLMSALCNLSALKNNQLRLVEDGCVMLVENAIKSHSLSLRTVAADIVRNLTIDQRSRNKLVDHNVIVTLMSMSRDSSEVIKRSCVQAFYNLSKDTACREKIVNGHAVSVIIKMSMENFQHVEMGRTAARTLRVLCGDRNVAHLLIRDGIVKALMSLIRTDDGIIRQYCAESICSLFQIGDVLGRLVEQGAVGVLVSLSQNNRDLITGEWCSFALYHLATNPVCPTSMLAHGILPCLIKLCDYSSSRSKYFCTAALAHITQIKEVDSSCAIPILVYMLQNETNPVTQTSCTISLYNLTDSDTNSCMMLEAGALQPVVELTQSLDIQTKMKCAAIISKLSLFKQYYYQFSADNVLKVLLDLSCVDHTLTQRRVVLALSNLTQSQELRRQLLDLNPITYIISLATKPDESLRRGCVSIVCNLSYEIGSEASIIKAGVMPTLLTTALVTSDKLQSKVICSKAVVNLMADPKLHRAMVKEGIIWALSTLALLEDPELLKLCINALCTLSCDYAREILRLSTAIKTIIHAINCPTNDLEIMLAGGRTLMNLLLQTTEKDEAFRKMAVENMSNLVQCKNDEVSEISILCLCVASQSESCRSVIVSTGMLHLIDVSTIFSQHRVSFAYLTMFGNIANNPLMRTELLDNQCLSRFAHICMSANPVLDMAVMRALYCLSCAPDNLKKLMDQNVLSILQTIWENSKNYGADGDSPVPSRPDTGSGAHGFNQSPTAHELNRQRSGVRPTTASKTVCSEVLLHLVATIYNISTSSACHAALVSQGAVRTLSSLWDITRDDYDACSLTCGAMLHLACGYVNSSRMIEDGCCEIICFITENKKNPKYSSYYFDNDTHERCAAALRNLLIVIPNQEALVEAGAIDALCSMATMSSPARLVKNEKAGTYKYVSIHDNCAAALRNLTYNVSLRPKLLSTGAIKVLMSSMTSSTTYEVKVSSTHTSELAGGTSSPALKMKSDGSPMNSQELSQQQQLEIQQQQQQQAMQQQGDDIYIGHKLLCELEAESWENGSRGKSKEGRALPMEPAPLYMELLKGSTNVQLDVEKRRGSLPKYTVQVLLEQLNEETEFDTVTLELGIDDLASFDDNDEASMPLVMKCPKQECEVNTLDETNPQALIGISESVHPREANNVSPPTSNTPLVASTPAGMPLSKMASRDVSNFAPSKNASFSMDVNDPPPPHSYSILANNYHIDLDAPNNEAENALLSTQLSEETLGSIANAMAAAVAAGASHAANEGTGPERNRSVHVGFSDIGGDHQQSNGNSNLLPFPPINKNLSYESNNHSNNISRTNSSSSRVGMSASLKNNNSNKSLPELMTSRKTPSSSSSTRKPISESRKMKSLVAVIKAAKEGKNGCGIEDIMSKWGSLSKY